PGNFVQGRIDIPFLIAYGFQFDIRGQLRRDARQLVFDVMDDFDGVRPRLPANFEGYGRLAIQPRDGTLLFGAIFDAANVANLDRRPVDVRHDEFFHVARVRVTAQRAEDQFAPAGFDIAAGHVRILALQSIAHRRNRTLVSRQ